MTTFEAELTQELRALPTAAPAALRERVRALGEPQPRRTVAPVRWRRAALVLVPACVVAIVAAAVIRGVVASGGSSHDASARLNPTVRSSTGGAAQAGSNSDRVRGARVFAPETKASPAIPAPSTTRHQDYQADLRVRVPDLESLGRKTAQAMQVTRSLGGYVASVSQSSARGEPGEADLVLRVPVARVEDAMIQLSGLGTVLEQHVSIVDLENTVRQQRQQVRALQLQIVRLTAALRQPPPAD